MIGEMRFRDFKKRAIDALKGRIFTTVLVCFIPQMILLVAIMVGVASFVLLMGNLGNMSLEQIAKKTFIEDHLKGTATEEGLIKGNESIAEKKALEQRAEKMMYADKEESNIVKLARLGDKIRKNNTSLIAAMLVVSIMVFIVFSSLVVPGLIKCLLDVGRMEDVRISVLFTNMKLVLKMFVIMIISYIVTILGMLLFIIPGCFIYARFYFAPFVLIDDQNKSILDCLKDSWQVSRNAGVINFYLLQLSFIGWGLAYEALLMLLASRLPLLAIFVQCLLLIYIYETMVQYYLYYSRQEHTINYANSYAN